MAVIASTTLTADVEAIQTAGFAAPGDRGHTLFRKKAVIEADERPARRLPLTAHAGQVVADGERLRIEQFGGKADWNGTTGTDNLGPHNEATKLYAASFGDLRPTYCIVYSGGKYWFSSTLEIRQPTWMLGLGQGNDTQGYGEATQLIFPNGICSIPRLLTRLSGRNGPRLRPSWHRSSDLTIEGFSIIQDRHANCEQHRAWCSSARQYARLRSAPFPISPATPSASRPTTPVLRGKRQSLVCWP